MTNLQEDKNSQPASSGVPKEVRNYEDEINLMDYALVLWKRRYLILFMTILPTLIAGLFFFFLGQTYKSMWTYDVEARYASPNGWRLTPKNYKFFMDKFYSSENVSKMKARLKEKGITTYPKEIIFDVLPHHIKLLDINFKNPSDLSVMLLEEAKLLDVTVTSNIESDIAGFVSVVRDNIENIMPIYMERRRLEYIKGGTLQRVADIKKSFIDAQFPLVKNRLILEKLKKVKSESGNLKNNNVSLHFTLAPRENSSPPLEYLPLNNQITATNTRIIKQEVELATAKERRDYYNKMLEIYEKCSDAIDKNISSRYTTQQYKEFVGNLAEVYKDAELKDYLTSHTEQLEERILVSSPLASTGIQPVSRGAVYKKIAAVFSTFLILSILLAFLLEQVSKARFHCSAEK